MEDTAYKMSSLNFCKPRLWSSGSASAEKIIFNVLNKPNMHDMLIIVKKFGAQAVLDVWKSSRQHIGSQYANRFMIPLIPTLERIALISENHADTTSKHTS